MNKLQSFVFLLLGTLIGLVCALVGVAQVFYGGHISAFVAFFGAALAFRPTRELLYNRTGFELHEKVLVSAVSGCLLIPLFMLLPNADSHDHAVREAQEQAERAEKAKAAEEANAYFSANRSQVVSSVRGMLGTGNLKAAASELNKYTLEDRDLAELRKELTVAQIRTRLSSGTDVPLEEQVRLREQLLSLQPGDAQFEEETAKLRVALRVQKETEEQERLKKAARDARAKQIESQFSGWDGSHRMVEEAIKNRMNDPDSYDHVETRYRERPSGLTVITKFRGKNAFGGVVTNVAIAEVDLEGRVLKLEMQ